MPVYAHTPENTVIRTRVSLRAGHFNDFSDPAYALLLSKSPFSVCSRSFLPILKRVFSPLLLRHCARSLSIVLGKHE